MSPTHHYYGYNRSGNFFTNLVIQFMLIYPYEVMKKNWCLLEVIIQKKV